MPGLRRSPLSYRCDLPCPVCAGLIFGRVGTDHAWFCLGPVQIPAGTGPSCGTAPTPTSLGLGPTLVPSAEELAAALRRELAHSLCGDRYASRSFGGRLLRPGRFCRIRGRYARCGCDVGRTT